MNWEAAWWQQMSGPQRLIERCADLLQNSGSVLLRVPEDLCWRQGLRAGTADTLSEWLGEGVLLEELDVRDSCPDVRKELDAGYAVLRALNPGSSSGYRPASGPIARYISKELSGIFSERVLWVKGFHNQQACRAFCDLCAHCAQGKVRIVLEDPCQWGKAVGNLAAADYGSFVSSFDVQLLCMMAANQLHADLPLLWRQYIAVLAANLGGQDAELAVELLSERFDLRAQPPLEALRALLEEPWLARRGSAPAHIFHHLRRDADGGAGAVNQLTWRAQMRVGLPILEQATLRVVELLRGDLESILARENIAQYNERVTKADAVEAGTLVYLMASGKLSVPDSQIRAAIHTIRENRNRLAHGAVCQPEQMEAVFQLEGLEH